MPLGPQPKHTAFPARLAQARLVKGLTQNELGKACGITSKGQMNKIERGTREPCLVHLTEICRALDVSADWLLGLSASGGPL